MKVKILNYYFNNAMLRHEIRCFVLAACLDTSSLNRIKEIVFKEFYKENEDEKEIGDRVDEWLYDLQVSGFIIKREVGKTSRILSRTRTYDVFEITNDGLTYLIDHTEGE